MAEHPYREASVDGELIELTAREYALLDTCAASTGQSCRARKSPNTSGTIGTIRAPMSSTSTYSGFAANSIGRLSRSSEPGAAQDIS